MKTLLLLLTLSALPAHAARPWCARDSDNNFLLTGVAQQNWVTTGRAYCLLHRHLHENGARPIARPERVGAGKDLGIGEELLAHLRLGYVPTLRPLPPVDIAKEGK
jgi:hypothetical protein